MLHNHNKECEGGRVRHVATHLEVVRTTVGNFNRFTCREHFTSPKTWEAEGWEGVQVNRSKL